VAGLFDEYLKEEAECGSDMISYAQLQYQAATGLQNSKVSNTLE